MFRKEFDTKESKYVALKEGLLTLREKKLKMVLNIHIPGTGGRSESEFPTREAFNNLENYMYSLEEDKTHPIPTILFEGVASKGDNYIPPAMRDTYTLATKEIPSLVKAWKSFHVIGGSRAEDWAAISRPSAFIFGLVKGAGSVTNNQLVIHTLEALEKEDVLPEEIFLSGHSRGAINCISMANEIYIRFGHQIKINMCLTDPVPGPMHGSDEYITEKVIPPNVISFTAFYASDEDNKLLLASDLSRLVFTNPNTTITCYGIPGTDHQTITMRGGSVEAVIYKKTWSWSIEEFSAYKTVNLLSPVYWAINHLTFAANGVVYEKGEERKDEALFDPDLIKGKGPRENAVFYKSTAISNECSSEMQTALKTIRLKLDKKEISNPSITNKNIFEIQDIKVPQDRKEFIHGVFKKTFSSNKSELKQDYENAKAYKQVKKIKNMILIQAKGSGPNDKEKWHKVTYKDSIGQSKMSFFNQEHYQQLQIINKADQDSCHDSLSPAWSTALDNLVSTWPQLSKEIEETSPVVKI